MNQLFLPYQLNQLIQQKGIEIPDCMAIIFPDGQVEVGSRQFADIILRRCEGHGAIKAFLYQQIVDWLELNYQVIFCRETFWDSWRWIIRNKQTGERMAPLKSFLEISEAIEEAFKLI